MPDQAETEFRDAITAEYNNDAAHAQLAMLLEKKGDVGGARTEAQTSVRLKPNVDGYLVLARLDLKQNQVANRTGRSSAGAGNRAGKCDGAAAKRRYRQQANRFKIDLGIAQL